ncbi:MAG: hypothetical protein R2747_24640 [Pyrinomonadaceae bacterium]
MKAIFTLNALSPAEKSLLKVKQIQAEEPVQQWIDLFTKMRDFDRQADRSRWWGGGMGCLGIILIIIGLPLISIMVGIAMIPIGIIVAAVGLFIYFYLKPYDIQGEVLTVRVLPLLMILREEMKPNEKLKLRLDLRGFEQPDKLTSQSPKRSTAIYRSIIDFYYRDHWMDGEATLADGTRLIWSVYDLVKHIKKIKYRKGKRKSKSKYRTSISMQIGMSRKRYRLPPLKQKGTEGVIKTQKAGDYVWMLVKKTVKHPPGQSFQPNDLVNTIAAAYIRATPVGGGK